MDKKQKTSPISSSATIDGPTEENEMLEDSEKEWMLTTIDNPYNPFTQFDLWKGYDEDMGYYTCSYLGRRSFVSPQLSDEDNLSAINEAIFDIVETDPFGIYIPVTKETFKKPKAGTVEG